MLAAPCTGAVAAVAVAAGRISAAIVAIEVPGKQSQEVALLHKQPARAIGTACPADVHARRPLRWT